MSTNATASSSPTSSAPQPTKVQSYVDRQIEQTRQQVRMIDLMASTLMLIVFVVGFFLLAAIVDAWVWPLGTVGRWIAFALLVGGTFALSVMWILPLLIRRINPEYAAKMIEEAKPGFANSLLNYVSLRRKPETVRTAVLDAVSRQAATDLSSVPSEETVDRSKLINVGMLVVGLTAATMAYWLLSPKSPLSTIPRILFPASDLAKPAAVQVLEVTPGKTRLFFGEPFQVTAMIRGIHAPEDVQLVYSTSDGRLVDQRIPMIPDETQPGLYQLDVFGDSGIRQSLTYKVVALDGSSPEFAVIVEPKPAITIESVELIPPKYTKLAKRTQSVGAIEAVEGTQVKIHALANMPISVAKMELLKEIKREGAEDAPARYLPVGAPFQMSVDQQKASSHFQLTLDANREQQAFTHYRVNFVSTDGENNRQANLYPIQIIPDLAPEIRMVNPVQSEVEIPLNGSLAVDLEAIDLDFQIAEIQLEIESDGSKLISNSLKLNSEDDSRRRATARYFIRPQELGLAVGDQGLFFGRALDNRTTYLSDSEPSPNVSRTKNIVFVVTAADENLDKANQAPEPQGNADEDRDDKSDSQPEEADDRNQVDGANDDQAQPNSGDEQNKEPQNEGAQPDKMDGSNEGNPNEGNPNEGNPNEGNPNEGNPNEGNPNEGNPNEGSPNEPPRNDPANKQKSSPQSNAQENADPNGQPESSNPESGDQQPAGSQSAGDQKAGQQQSAGNQSSGNQAAGDQQPSGNQSAGDRGAGQTQPAGNQSSGNQAAGDQQPSGNQSAGDQGAGQQQPTGNQSSGNQAAGDQQPSGNQSAGDRGAGQTQPAGNQSSGNDQLLNDASPSDVFEKIEEYVKEKQREQADPNKRNSDSPEGGAKEENQGDSGNPEGDSQPNQSGDQGDGSQGGNAQDKADPQSGSREGGGNKNDSQEGGAKEGGSQEGSKEGGSQQNAPQEGGQGNSGNPNGDNQPKQGGNQGGVGQGDNAQETQQGGAKEGGSQEGSKEGGSQQNAPQEGGQGNSGNPDGDNQPKQGGDQGDGGQGGQDQNQTDPQSGSQEGGSQGSDAKESGAKESGAKEGEAKENGAKEGGSQDDAAQERGSQDGGSPEGGSSENDPQKDDPGNSKNPDGDAQPEQDGNQGDGGQGGQDQNQTDPQSGSQDDGGSKESGAKEGGSKEGGKPGEGGSKKEGQQPQSADKPNDSNQSPVGEGSQASQGGQPSKQSNDQKGKESQGNPQSDQIPSSNGSGTSGSASERLEKDQENLAHAKERADLVLQHLAEQKNEPDPELLKKLGWTPEQLKQFAERYQKMKEAAQAGDIKAQQQYDRAIKALNFRPAGSKQKVSQSSEKPEGFSEDSERSQLPPRLRRRFESFQSDLHRMGNQ